MTLSGGLEFSSLILKLMPLILIANYFQNSKASSFGIAINLVCCYIVINLVISE